MSSQTPGAWSAAPLWFALLWAFQAFLDSEDPSASASSYSLASKLGEDGEDGEEIGFGDMNAEDWVNSLY